MLINKLYNKSLFLKAILYIIIIVVLSASGYKIYRTYKYIINFTATDFTDWLKQKSCNNFELKFTNIKFNSSLINLYFDVENIQLKWQDNTIYINNIQGKINTLFYILYSKIKITDLILNEINLNLNNIADKTIIHQLTGNVDCYLNDNNNFVNIKYYLLEPINNIEFNVNLVVNIDNKLNHVAISEFRLNNITKNIRDIMQYLPEYFINNKLLQWLNNAVLSGSIDKNELIWIKDHKFSWQVKFKNITLKYMDAWPPLEHLCMTMDIIEDNFKIQMDSGELQGFIVQQPIKQLQATLNNINVDNVEPLLIRAAVIAPVSKGLEFINNSNIKYLNNNLYEYINKLKPQGNMNLSITLSVPIAVNIKEEVMFNIVCNFNNANIQFSAFDVHLTNLSGDISITNDSILVNNLAISNQPLPVPIKFIIKQHDVIIESPEITAAWVLDQQHDFVIKELILLGKSLGKVKVSVNAANDALYFDNEYAKGHILLNDLKQGNYILNFEKLTIKDININSAKQNSSVLNKINNIIFNCKNFYFNNLNIGEVHGVINKDNNLHITGKANFKDLNANIPIINNGVGVVDFNIAWSNYMQGFLWKEINGQINIELKNGVVIGLEPGLGRVIGLLSIENIKRRLSLDFTDVTNPGFAFDILNGNLEVEAGIIKIKYMAIQGPAAKMIITGEVALDTQQINLFVEVSSKIGSTLPIAAAIAAGNPIVGAAIWLFDKVSNVKVGELRVEKYKIVGNLEQPEIIEL